MAPRILMIEDDRRLADMVSNYLGEQGFDVRVCLDATTGLASLRCEIVDAVLLDVMLPDMDGFEVCRRIREESRLPIIMLTARGEETDRIVGLELGADDYLPKPFNPRELLARIRAVLRRTAQYGDDDRRRLPLSFGTLEIDRDAREARLEGQRLDLTSHQFDLLRILAENRGRVLSRDAIMDKMSGESMTAFDRSIDVHISRIRAAIEIDPKDPRRILTVRGVGYLFAKDQNEKA